MTTHSFFFSFITIACLIECCTMRMVHECVEKCTHTHVLHFLVVTMHLSLLPNTPLTLSMTPQSRDRLMKFRILNINRTNGTTFFTPARIRPSWYQSVTVRLNFWINQFSRWRVTDLTHSCDVSGCGLLPCSRQCNAHPLLPSDSCITSSERERESLNG